MHNEETEKRRQRETKERLRASLILLCFCMQTSFFLNNNQGAHVTSRSIARFSMIYSRVNFPQGGSLEHNPIQLFKGGEAATWAMSLTHLSFFHLSTDRHLASLFDPSSPYTFKKVNNTQRLSCAWDTMASTKEEEGCSVQVGPLK